jgi:hypothetical protein
MTRATVGNLVLLAASLLLGLGAAEIVVRLAAPQETMYPRFIPSDEYPIELPRNAEIVHAQGRKWRFVYRTNALGRRGPFLAPSEARSRCTVVALGDSFTFGMGVPDDAVYTEVMRRSLGDGFAVVNGGMGGWGIDSEIKWYFDVGSAYAPQFVLIQFTANDPWDFVEVATIENDEFQFHPYDSWKPAWGWWISRSRFLQTSHLYSLARAAYGTRGQLAASGAGSPGDEARYVRMLDLFTRQMIDQGRHVLFVSVTQWNAEHGRTIYDVDLFPEIRTAVDELARQGRLTWIELPLDRIEREPSSPEGHQWGDGHHRIVGTRIVEAIGDLAGSVDCGADL